MLTLSISARKLNGAKLQNMLLTLEITRPAKAMAIKLEDIDLYRPSICKHEIKQMSQQLLLETH